MLVRAIRFWWFDWRYNRHWVLLAIICFCLFSLCLLRCVSGALKETTLQDTNKVVGADWIVESSMAPDPAWLENAQTLKIPAAITMETSSVIVQGDQTAWVSVKAVGENYPLREPVVIQTKVGGSKRKQFSGPQPGKVWVAPQLYYQLNLALGDFIGVGYASLQLTALILEEPDRSGRFYDLAPRVMMHWRDVEATRLIQSHSRAIYRTLFLEQPLLKNKILENKGSWESYSAWLKPTLRVHDELKSGLNLRPALKSSVERAKTYYDLIGVMALLLSGSALMLSLDRYLRRQYPKIALLKTLGLSTARIGLIYTVHWLCMSALASAIALLLTQIVFVTLAHFLSSLYGLQLVHPGVWSMVQSVLLALSWLWGAGFVRLVQVLQLSPAAIISGQTGQDYLKQKFFWLASGIIFSVMLWVIVFGKSFVLVLLGVLSWSCLLVLILFFFARLIKPRLSSLTLRFRLVFRQWFHLPRLFFLQVITLSFVLVSCVSIFQFKNDLFSAWESQIPENAPNYFLINIFEENVEALKALAGELEFSPSEPYPIVRGRLVKINDELVSGEQEEGGGGERRMERELNLTWTNNLPYRNRILEGEWLTESTERKQVSVEAGVAERAGIELGDELTFSIALRELKVRVTSLREVRWDTMTPNFYMIFPPGLMDDESFTYLMSLYVPKGIALKVAAINQSFPEVNTLDISVFIDQIRKIKDYVALALGFANSVLVCAVVGVMFAAISTTWDERLLMYSISQLIGVDRSWVIVSLVYEYALLGFICGLLAVLATQGLAYWGYANVFDLPWSPNIALILCTPMLSAIFLSVFAGFSAYIMLRSQTFERTRSLMGR